MQDLLFYLFYNVSLLPSGVAVTRSAMLSRINEEHIYEQRALLPF